MLVLHVEEQEYYDDREQRFVTLPAATLEFEHSLLAISKWEFLTEKAFFAKADRTPEEHLLYIQCMRLDNNDPMVLNRLQQSDFVKINEYINKNATATTFMDQPGTGKSSRVITSELVYFWMTSYQIPFSAETWHINRLLTLIRIAGIENQPKKKRMSRAEVMAQNRALNEQRLARMGTTG